MSDPRCKQCKAKLELHPVIIKEDLTNCDGEVMELETCIGYNISSDECSCQTTIKKHHFFKNRHDAIEYWNNEK